MSNSRFCLRPTTTDDAPALNDLYRRLTGRARSIEAWRWQWRDGPRGPAPSWVLIDDNDGSVIGHHGVVPVSLRIAGRTVSAGRTENTMLDPDYRKQLYWPGFEKQLLGEYEARFEVLFTCAGKGAPAAVRRRMGYKPVATWETLRVATLPAHWATRKLGPLGRVARLLGPHSVERPPQDWELESTEDVERIARLWEASASAYPLAAERDAETLRWRFQAHPFHAHRLDVLRHGGADVGYLATWEHAIRGGALRLSVEDIFVRDNDEASYRAGLMHLVWRHRRRPVSVRLRTVGLDRPLRRAVLGLPGAWMAPPAAVGEGEADLLARGPLAPPDGPWDVTMIVDQGAHAAGARAAPQGTPG